MKRIVAFCAGVAVVAMFGTAGAYFTAQTQVAENIVRSGTVAVACEPSVSAVEIERLAPGAPQARVLTVRNTGTLPQEFVVTEAKKMGITAFYQALHVKVSHGDRVLYNGRLEGMRTLPVHLAADEEAAVEIEVLLPADAGNDLADDYVKLTFYVDAEQSRP